MSINIRSRVLRGAVATVGTAVVATVALWAPGAPGAHADGQTDGQTTLALCTTPPPPAPGNDPTLSLVCGRYGWYWVHM
jgi:hypothetical protein